MKDEGMLTRKYLNNLNNSNNVKNKDAFEIWIKSQLKQKVQDIFITCSCPTYFTIHHLHSPKLIHNKPFSLVQSMQHVKLS